MQIDYLEAVRQTGPKTRRGHVAGQDWRRWRIKTAASQASRRVVRTMAAGGGAMAKEGLGLAVLGVGDDAEMRCRGRRQSVDQKGRADQGASPVASAPKA